MRALGRKRSWPRVSNYVHVKEGNYDSDHEIGRSALSVWLLGLLMVSFPTMVDVARFWGILFSP